MKVRELIEALKKMPENADIVVGNEIGEYDAMHLHAIYADSEYGDYGECYYFKFNFGERDRFFVCQKSLLTEGTIEEFEELFEDVIVRKI